MDLEIPTELFCFFCGSEIDYDIELKYAECLLCEAYFELEVEKGCIRDIKIAWCGKECSCVQEH